MAATAFIRRVLAPATAAAPLHSDGGGVPYWAPIIVAICGAVILATAIGFALVFLKRWRRRRSRVGGCRRRTLVIDGREVSVYRGGNGDTSTETLEVAAAAAAAAAARAGKLRKRDLRVSQGGGRWERSSGEDSGRLRESVLSLPPVLPMIRRASSVRWSVAGTSGRGMLPQEGEGEMTMSGAVVSNNSSLRPGSVPRRRTSNAWVDEDAIHGPEMNVSPRKNKKDSKERSYKVKKPRAPRFWRRSLRETWPLKAVSPTLPRISSFGSFSSSTKFAPFSSPKLPSSADRASSSSTLTRPPLVHDAASTYRYQHHYKTAVPPEPVVPQIPPLRQLPKPPSQALLVAVDEAAERIGSAPLGTFVPRSRGLSYYTDECTGDKLVPAPLRTSRGAPSSESTLTNILRTTEERLADGNGIVAAGGSTRRSRGSVGPRPKVGGRERSGTVSTGVGGGSNVTLVGSGTPKSRTPSPPKTSGRNVSVVVQNNRSSRRHSRSDSRDSVVSDADSFVALAPSPEGGSVQQGLSSPNRNSPSRKQRQEVELRDEPSDGELSDLPEVDEDTPPKANHHETKTVIAIRRAPLENYDPFVTLTLGGSKEHRVHPASRVHAFNDAPRLGLGPGPRTSEMTLSVLRSTSPLSNISGNSRGSPDLHGPRRHSVSPQRGVHTTTQTPRVPPGPPIYPLSQPASAEVSTANLLLHQQQRSLSPVADDEEEEEEESLAKSSLIVPQSKRLSELRASALQPRASSPTLGRTSLAKRFSRSQTPDMPPPSVALPRVPSSYYDTHDDEVAERAASGGEAARKPSDDSSHFTDFEREKLAALNSNKLLELIQADGRRRSQTIRMVPPESFVELPTTIAQLRRMNSQVSGYSDSGSSSGGSTGAGAVLTTLREEDTGKFVSPPRPREASRNYRHIGRVSKGSGNVVGSVAQRYEFLHHDKENARREDDAELKVPRLDFGGNVIGTAGPGRPFKSPARSVPRTVEKSPERKSDESQYDADGFWISPARRKAGRDLRDK